METEVKNEAKDMKLKQDEKLIAILCHALGMIIVPLAVYLIKKDQSPYLAFQAKQALVWQAVVSIALTVASFAVGTLASLTFGLGGLLFLLLPPAGLVAFCFGLYAAYQCWIDKEYEYPLIKSVVDAI